MRIAADARQSALGWKDSLSLDRTGSVHLAILDRSGQPVTGLSARGTLGRPFTGRHDVPLAFTESRAARYTAGVAPIAPGAWQIDVELRDQSAPGMTALEPTYRLRRRVWLAP